MSVDDGEEGPAIPPRVREVFDLNSRVAFHRPPTPQQQGLSGRQIFRLAWNNHIGNLKQNKDTLINNYTHIDQVIGIIKG